MTTSSSASGMSGQILADAARRMLPVLAGRVLAAVTDRAVEKVDGLADRLADRTTAAGGRAHDDDGDGDGASGGRAGGAVSFLLEQARLFLAFVVRLAAQALEMLRRATEKLRERRAPEGIDAAPAPEEITDPDEFDDEYDDDLEYEDSDEDEYEDEDDEERTPARV